METDRFLEQGAIFFNQGKLVEAEQCFSQIPAGHPQYPDSLHNLGLIAWKRGELDTALEKVERAVTFAPNAAVYLNSLGEIQRMRGEFDRAEEILLRALTIQPEMAMAHNNLGMLYQSQGRFAESITAFNQAVHLLPEMFMAHYNLGISLKEINRLDASIAAYRRALELDPDFVEAHVNLALVLLLHGQLPEGFQEYEWRLRPEFSSSPPFGSPRWDGMIDSQATLLVHTEQGCGDTIQFIRYLPFIAAESMRVIVRCPAEMQGLLQSVEGVAMVFAPGETLPDFDFHIPLLSLPFLFHTDLTKIPGEVPYLSAPFEKKQAWRERLFALGETIKIGLRWYGNPNNTHDRERSLPLAQFELLAGMPQVTFISLQNSPLTEVEQASAEKLGLIDVSADLCDFTDTAALIAGLDMVIAVDTAVLHLAGALGRPAWALLKFAPHWPWLLEREDTPWYPGMRLFRQEQRGDWEGVMRQVAGLLREVMNTVRE